LFYDRDEWFRYDCRLSVFVQKLFFEERGLPGFSAILDGDGERTMGDHVAVERVAGTLFVRLLENLLTWNEDQFQPLLPDLLAACQESAQRIELFWQGRPVRVRYPAIKAGTSRRYWEEYSMDDWDNCVDENWLTFNLRNG